MYLMDKKNLPTIILIIIIAAFAFYIFSADTIFAKEEEKYNVNLLTVLTTAYDPFNTQAMMGVYAARKSGVVDAEFTLIDTQKSPAESLETAASNSDTDLICGVGFTLQEPIVISAQLNPNMNYLTVDMPYDESSLPRNLANIVFRSNEASYVAGYVAGMTTKTNIIGFVGGMDTDIINGFYYGFMSGIAKAEKEKGQKITVILEYVDSYIDEFTGAIIADNMYDKNADIIYSVAGSSGNGVIKIAKDRNKYVIGIDSDQNYMAPENVIFSVIKKIDVSICNTITDYANKINYGGKTISVGYAEDGVGVVSYLENVIDKRVIEKAESLENEIKSGTIIVPNTEAEYSAYLRSGTY